MQTIALISSAPGCGKTTLARHLAAQAGALGYGSAALLTYPDVKDEAGDLPAPPGVIVGPSSPSSLADDAKELGAADVQFALLDTSGGASDTLGPCLAVADLVVIPMRPEPNSFRNITKLIARVEDSGKPFVFVINAAEPDAAGTSASAIALAQFGAVCPVIVAAAEQPEVLPENPEDSDFAQQISELWRYLAARVGPPEPSRADDEAAGTERRRFPRWEYSAKATLVWGGTKRACEVLDISAGGMAIRGAELPEEGSIVSVVVPNLGAVTGEVVHAASDRRGLRFVMDARARLEIVNKVSEIVAAAQGGARKAVG